MKRIDESNINHKKEEDNAIFKSEDEMRKSLKRFCYGDLYVIGRLWIEALKFILLGAKISLIPSIKAAKPDIPEKPQPIRYKDLPIYKSPHFEYKEYIANKEKCSQADDKLLHKFLLPHVTYCRIYTQKQFYNAKCTFKNTYKEICTSIDKNKEDFKQYMRCPDNLQLRQSVLAATTVTGYLLGSGRGIPRRIFFTSLGALAGGSLCFPVETDEAFRAFLCHAGKTFAAVYNVYCKSFAIKKPISSKDELSSLTTFKNAPCPDNK